VIVFTYKRKLLANRARMRISELQRDQQPWFRRKLVDRLKKDGRKAVSPEVLAKFLYARDKTC
jgi:hypothetical protein